jgi:hypothetical protein
MRRPDRLWNTDILNKGCVVGRQFDQDVLSNVSCCGEKVVKLDSIRLEDTVWCRGRQCLSFLKE